MTMKGRTLRRSILTGLLLMGFTSGAQGQVPGPGVGSFGGELRGITQFTGRVVCVGCTLQEAREAQPQLTNLYELNHVDRRQGQVVMRVEKFLDPAEQFRWESIVGLSHRLQVRAADAVFQELTAEENRFKEFTVTGLLRSTNTLDIGGIEVRG